MQCEIRRVQKIIHPSFSHTGKLRIEFIIAALSEKDFPYWKGINVDLIKDNIIDILATHQTNNIKCLQYNKCEILPEGT